MRNVVAPLILALHLFSTGCRPQIYGIEPASENTSTAATASAGDEPTLAPAAPLPATSLSWDLASPHYAIPSSEIPATWVVSESTNIQSQSLQFYADAACGTELGSPIPLATSATNTQALVPDSDGIYSFKITSTNNQGVSAISDCSTPMTIVMLDGKILINNGSAYTPSSTVIVEPISVFGTEVYLTDTPGCASGGTWKKLASQVWTLPNPNAVNTLYAKFRDSTLTPTTSACVSATITHDNIPPASYSPGSIDLSGPDPLTTKVLGMVSADTKYVRIFSDSDCEVQIGSGTGAEFESPGISVNIDVPGRQYDFYAQAFDLAGNASACTRVYGYTDGATTVSDHWSRSLASTPITERSHHSAVWTGSSMIIWGGIEGQAENTIHQTNTGAIYDPDNDTWKPTSLLNAPAKRYGHSAVWTGKKMIVWGGNQSTRDGASYDPETNTWAAISTTDAPMPRYGHTAIWTGTKMIIWGGMDGDTDGATDSGYAYDPENDAWSAISMTNAPTARTAHTAVWTGTKMIIWGGWNLTAATNTGAIYDPATDAWTTISSATVPEARYDHTAVWTGSQMIVWGGRISNPATPLQAPLGSGGAFDPKKNKWSTVATTAVPTNGSSHSPTPRYRHSAVWTGTQMLIWGGWSNSNTLHGYGNVRTGAAYNPLTRVWSALKQDVSELEYRQLHTAVWTGSKMIIFGGKGNTTNISGNDYGFWRLAAGWAYRPTDKSWAKINQGLGHVANGAAAVWTGSEMIIWGGLTHANYAINTGKIYNPDTDSWTSISTTNAPEGRSSASAFWTGSKMIVWGGWNGINYLATGGVYDPLSDTWTTISTTNAPSARLGYGTVWTGSKMIIWGGCVLGTGTVNTGYIFDPATNTWSTISAVNAPEGRAAFSSVWTGSKMIVWGGQTQNSAGIGLTELNTGGVYDLAGNSWTATTLTNAPAARHTTGLWINSRLFIWGWSGLAGSSHNDGALYDPATDSWTTVSATNAPHQQSRFSLVSTGSHVILWGGDKDTSRGFMFDPVGDAWSEITTVNAPLAPEDPIAFWIGNKMMVYGGIGGTTGGFYTP